MTSERALNEDFNLSTAESTTVLELVELIWQKINGDKHLRVVCDPGFEYDVTRRVPSVEKAETVLGFVAQTSLDTMLDEVIPWIRNAIDSGQI
jgi:nucleoside-diphosphate-sugar epimerase